MKQQRKGKYHLYVRLLTSTKINKNEERKDDLMEEPQGSGNNCNSHLKASVGHSLMDYIQLHDNIKKR